MEQEIMVNAYADTVLEEAAKYNAPLNESFAQNIWERGNYICELYHIDFAYILLPLEKGKIKYICVSQNSKFNEINPTDKYIGKISEYTLTADEQAVWQGEKEISHSVTAAKVSHEISTMKRVTDPQGNAVIVGVDQSYEDVHESVINFFFMLAGMILIVSVAIYLFLYLVIRQRVSKPAQKISEGMHKFIIDGKRSGEKIELGGKDEFSMIADSFNSMTDDINNYIENINSLTREQERQNAELDIAARIQKGFLPEETFVAANYKVRATMIPAKNVGGDFYDYLTLDSHRILTVIADVSGKGVSALQFMAVTMMLIRQYAKMGCTPAEILTKTNDTLSSNNAEMLFTTAFLGIYDTRTAEFTYSNAGHNLPYLISGGTLTALGGANGSLLGLFAGEKYENKAVKLASGDSVFMYTDGVTESVNAENRFFGEKRLQDELLSKEDKVGGIVAELLSFENGAEQHDDITMLEFTVKAETELELDFEVSEFAKIKAAILSSDLPRSVQLSLCLTAEEYFTNICSYAFRPTVPEGEKIKFRFSCGDKVTMQFEDGGAPFNPIKGSEELEDYDIDTKIGGLGRFIALSNVDDAKYENINGKNVLTLIKNIKEEN
ncbi:MAG: SpoIIE family protein phosphatase [Clostridiales bacterium]|nr:SpoIIE family protein phosphatase [Candidatus Equinaster intestinalis]